MFLAEFTLERQQQVLHALAPRSDLGSPAAGVAFEGAGAIVAEFIRNPPQGPLPEGPVTVTDPPADKESSFLPAWQPLVVGFASGLLVGVLAVLQLREWRRKEPPLNESPGLSRTPVGAASPAEGSTDITSSPHPRPR